MTGKTTALERLSSYLRERGYRVYTVPEAATMLFSNGVFFSDLTDEAKTVNFQANLMGTQMALEDTFKSLGKATGEVKSGVDHCLGQAGTHSSSPAQG